MTLELIFGSVAALGALASAAFGGGILTRFIKHSNELAVTKYMLTETQSKLEVLIKDFGELKYSSAEVHVRVEQFQEHIKKLDLLPELDAKLNSMEKLVQSVQSLVTMLASEYKKH